jgi:hypothetical protein
MQTGSNVIPLAIGKETDEGGDACPNGKKFCSVFSGRNFLNFKRRCV